MSADASVITRSASARGSARSAIVSREPSTSPENSSRENRSASSSHRCRRCRIRWAARMSSRLRARRTTSVGRSGLVRKSFAPGRAARGSAPWSCVGGEDDDRHEVVVGGRVAHRLHAPRTPSMSGMCRSSSTRSGRSVAIESTTSRVHRSECDRATRRPRQDAARRAAMFGSWSSTTRTGRRRRAPVVDGSTPAAPRSTTGGVGEVCGTARRRASRSSPRRSAWSGRRGARRRAAAGPGRAWRRR